MHPSHNTRRGRPRVSLAHWLIVATLQLVATGIQAADSSMRESSASRPKIGLVLAGGGAKGAAHVGVLRVLEELHIPIDYIAGTSMGSVVGGLYASGMSADAIEREIGSIDWKDVFVDEPAREDLTFRRKSDDRVYMFDAKPGLKDGSVRLPLAYVHGQKFDMQLNRLTRHVAGIKDFDRLPIPFRAIAADIETGEEVVIGNGKLARAIRASMAVPGAFDPVRMGDRLLVDGGIANNIPISVARNMGADIVIVSELGIETLKREEITSALGVAGQMVNFLFVINSREQLKTLTQRDIRISVKLGDIGAGSFDRIQEAIPLGEQAARTQSDSLRRLAMTPSDYASHQAARNPIIPLSPRVASVKIVNRSALDDAVITERLRVRPGEPLDNAVLEEDIQKLYGLDIFESVRYDLTNEDGETGVVLYANEKPWGPRYLQFGMINSSDMQGDEDFRMGMTLTQMPLNPLNGELRLGGQIGGEPGVFAEIFQPLEPAAQYFFNGRLGYGVRKTNLYQRNQQIAELRSTGGTLDVALGRQLGGWGESRMGFVRQAGTQEVSIGPDLPDNHYDTAQAYLRLTSDELDNLFFPTQGHIAGAEYHVFRKDLGSDNDFEQVGLDYMQAARWGQTVWLAGGMLRSTIAGQAPPQEQFRLGGFLRLSGMGQDQLTGQHSALARLVLMQPVSDVHFFKGYAGVSLEAGNTWADGSDMGLDDSVIAGSIFVGASTPIGPLYLGYGYNDDSQGSVYLTLGPLFSF